jgi:hypothetical protein
MKQRWPSIFILYSCLRAARRAVGAQPVVICANQAAGS